jgi:hypothetical protein
MMSECCDLPHRDLRCQPHPGGSHAGNDPHLLQPLPRQPQHQGIELLARELRHACRFIGPAEPALIDRRTAHQRPKPSCTSSLTRVCGNWRTGSRGAPWPRRIPARRAPAGARGRSADRRGGPPATSRRRGSPQQLAQPCCALASRHHRPGHAHDQRSALDFRADLVGRCRRSD